MKIIAIFILVLELLALVLQIHSECKRNNITPSSLKNKFDKFKAKSKPSTIKWRKK